MFLRKAMVFVHPDKQPDHKASANALQQILNHLVHELRGPPPDPSAWTPSGPLWTPRTPLWNPYH